MKISPTRICGSLACSLARFVASSISSSEMSTVCAAWRRTSFAHTIEAVIWSTSELRSMPRDFRNLAQLSRIGGCSASRPAASWLLSSASVAVTFWRLASCSSNLLVDQRAQHLRPEALTNFRRVRNVRRDHDERMRVARSNIEMTSSLTTAAIRISGAAAVPPCGALRRPLARRLHRRVAPRWACVSPMPYSRHEPEDDAPNHQTAPSTANLGSLFPTHPDTP